MKNIHKKYLELFKKHKFYLKKKKSSIIFTIILFFVFIFTILAFFISYLLFIKLTNPLPDVSSLKKIKIPEASIIYDRDGNELYKIYSENRVYVPYDKISENMINAIVAWEDKRFWTNPWYDTIWIIRAIINWLKNWYRFEWTSWITQQLARLMYLSNERTIERKLKEIYLAIELTNKFDKKLILELYLNKIFFGWNSYWVEQASKTYFWKSSSDLNVLESSILASLPKAPTSLSPYWKKDKLLGYLLISSLDNPKDNYKVLSKELLEWNKNIISEYEKILDFLQIKKIRNWLEICNITRTNFNLNKIKINDNWCVNINYSDLSTFLSGLFYKNNKYKIEYIPWRKDYVLSRMLEDWYITFDEYKKAIIESFWYEFKKYIDKIKYPYFVMYVKDYLVKLYWEDVLKTWGLKIYTTIDPKLQDKAQELIEKQVKINSKKYWANNAALISIDNKTWEILAFIWWVDYFDKQNLWYNNMLLAKLQPGSSFKPFVYILAMIKNNFHADTILTDKKMTFPWGYRPHNSDNQYLWKMTLSKALNYSRNIPAVKLYYAAWKEDEIINFLDWFWFYSLREFKKSFKEKYWYEYSYSAPMVLWTVQISALELVGAYSVFANNWIKKTIVPIKKIVDDKWKVILDNSKYLNQKRVIDEKWAKEMNEILSDEFKRPKDWNYFLTIPWRKLAAKTWTSTKQYLDNKWSKDSKWRLYKKRIIFPRDMWTVWYSPQITTVVWAWNTSWKELKPKAYGINWAGPIMRDFMKFAHEWKEVIEW